MNIKLNIDVLYAWRHDVFIIHITNVIQFVCASKIYKESLMKGRSPIYSKITYYFKWIPCQVLSLFFDTNKCSIVQAAINYEMNFTLCVLLVYNDNGSVQTLCITRVSAFCTKCLHRLIVIINQQYTKGEIHFIYLHYFHVFGLCFINQNHWNG